jgi:hypothetical protein
MFFIFFALKTLAFFSASAQMGPQYGQLFYLTDLQGQPLTSRLVNNYVDGTPFFKENWLNATLMENNGRTYKDIKIKLDLLENRIYFLDTKEAERELTSPVKTIVLDDPSSGKTMTFVDINDIGKQRTESGKWWCQKLIEGDATLIKNYNKVKYESKGYNSAGLEISVKDEIRWFIVKEGQLLSFRKQKELVELLKKDDPSIANFKPSGNNAEMQYIDIVNAYNAGKKKQ